MTHRYERNVDPHIGKVNVCVFCSQPFNHENHRTGPTTDTIYFEPQTGIIREQPARSNFYQYRLAPSDRPVIEAAVAKATPGCGGLEYEGEFLHSLETMERKHQRQLARW